MIKKIKYKFKQDDGNSIIIFGLMLIVALLVVGGTLLDLSKAFQMKSAYTESARKATQSAIRYQNTRGFLKPEAAAEAIRVYEHITRPAIIKDGYMSACEELRTAAGKRNVNIKVYYMNDDFIRGRHMVEIDSANIITPTNDANNDIKSIMLQARVYNNGSSVGNLDNNRASIEKEKYTGVEIELYESTPNIILPAAASIVQDDGTSMKCQLIGIKAGASKLVGQDGFE